MDEKKIMNFILFFVSVIAAIAGVFAAKVAHDTGWFDGYSQAIRDYEESKRRKERSNG